MKAASTISVRDGHAIVKAGEFIEARFGAGTSPSLAARKTLALLIAKAAGEAWRPGSHVIAKRELRDTHNANDRIQDTLDELMDVKFQMPSTSAQGRAATLTAALLAWTLNEHAEDGRATVERPDERRVGKASVSTCRSRRAPHHTKQKKHTNPPVT